VIILYRKHGGAWLRTPQVEQIRIGLDNFSYVVYCPATKNATIVDPGFTIDPALNSISSKKLSLQYVIVTHYHDDHAFALSQVKKSQSLKTVASKLDSKLLNTLVDLCVDDGDELRLGKGTVRFILTPGHTPSDLCILVDNRALLTGDTLFIGDCGRTDLPSGNTNAMFSSLQKKLMFLPDRLVVYPGHDYGDTPYDTLGNQKKTNKALLAKSVEALQQIP
jgi:hydroxyacylglutathione hydrolase